MIHILCDHKMNEWSEKQAQSSLPFVNVKWAWDHSICLFFPPYEWEDLFKSDTIKVFPDICSYKVEQQHEHKINTTKKRHEMQL